MLRGIYILLIYPIELFLGIVFSVIDHICNDPGIAIIGVSIVINILLLPLYNRADEISNAERVKQEGMKNWVSHIKKSFTGDERFMMLNTLYRKQHYHPLYSLKGSLPLLLQIPFFIAAYHFLSNLNILNGRLFMGIKDLGQPDNMIIIPTIGLNLYTEKYAMQDLTMITSASGTRTYPAMVLLPSIFINLLPILMTVINIISIIVYTKGSMLKEKVQLFVMAGLFFVLLYNSPSGLVIYWTMNNVFSLAKNVITDVRKNKKEISQEGNNISKDIYVLSLLGAVLLSLLIGVVIPSSVIAASPAEFVIPTAYKNPLQYVLSTFLIAAGIFLVWLPIFYYLASNKLKRFVCFLIWIVGGIALVDYLFFGKVDMFLSDSLRYDKQLVFSTGKIAMNLIVLIILVAVMIIVFIRKSSWIKSVYGVLIFGLIALSMVNIAQVEKRLKTDMSATAVNNEPYKGFSLSRNGKNVIVFMLDRAIGLYIPYIMNERPELMEKFSGFVYYPNTITHGVYTIEGAPGLFGGYEYTPDKLDERSEEMLVDKHNESLKVMPVVFSENGYKTTVYDVPYAGYSEISDLSIYDEYPEIGAYSLQNRFIDSDVVSFISEYTKRCFIMYSFHKVVPVIMQKYVYDDGDYLYPDSLNYPELYPLDCISILENLSNLTEVSDSNQNTFMMIDNNMAHSTYELQLPDYTIDGNINNKGLETGYRTDSDGKVFELDCERHYHVNIAALIQIGYWLDYLKENGIYDNTRIILVSDHGYNNGEFDNMIMDDGTDLEMVMPLLMVKDYNSTEFSISEEFMTNADTPILAMQGLIENPVNPFTNKLIDGHEKTDEERLILYAEDFDLEESRNDYVFDEPGQFWLTVDGDVRDKSNWSRVER